MTSLAGTILILSGSPGSGKTTSAEALSRVPGVPKVHLHSDDFWGYIKHGHIDPWRPEAAVQNRMIMDIAAGASARYAQDGYFVVLDGVVGPWALGPFRSMSAPTHYIVLRTSAEEAVGRCTARGGDSLTDPAVVADLHAQFADLDDYEPHALNVEGLGAEQTVSKVLAALQSGAFRLRWGGRWPLAACGSKGRSPKRTGARLAVRGVRPETTVQGRTQAGADHSSIGSPATAPSS